MCSCDLSAQVPCGGSGGVVVENVANVGVGGDHLVTEIEALVREKMVRPFSVMLFNRSMTWVVVHNILCFFFQSLSLSLILICFQFVCSSLVYLNELALVALDVRSVYVWVCWAVLLFFWHGVIAIAWLVNLENFGWLETISIVAAIFMSRKMRVHYSRLVDSSSSWAFIGFLDFNREQRAVCYSQQRLSQSTTVSSANSDKSYVARAYSAAHHRLIIYVATLAVYSWPTAKSLT